MPPPPKSDPGYALGRFAHIEENSNAVWFIGAELNAFLFVADGGAPEGMAAALGVFVEAVDEGCEADSVCERCQRCSPNRDNEVRAGASLALLKMLANRPVYRIQRREGAKAQFSTAGGGTAPKSQNSPKIIRVPPYYVQIGTSDFGRGPCLPPCPPPVFGPACQNQQQSNAVLLANAANNNLTPKTASF